MPGCAAGSVIQEGYEIGLCHDLLEKTQTTYAELLAHLLAFGYVTAEAEVIAAGVMELTDVFTKDAYPKLNKESRKYKKDERLAGISPAAQTVKYADLIYNINWVLAFDKVHAKKYLKKKQLLLTCLSRGDKKLHESVVRLISHSLDELKNL